MELGNFFQWVDGSFIGRSKENPRDIDLVSFVEYNKYRKYYKDFEALKKLYPKIDSYSVPVYPP